MSFGLISFAEESSRQPDIDYAVWVLVTTFLWVYNE